MNFDLQKVLESKRALRRHLATRPVAEKLRMLDVMRERELAIREHGVRQSNSAFVREETAAYGQKSS